MGDRIPSEGKSKQNAIQGPPHQIRGSPQLTEVNCPEPNTGQYRGRSRSLPPHQFLDFWNSHTDLPELTKLNTFRKEGKATTRSVER